MKKAAALLTLALCACATTQPVTTTFYRAAGQADQWSITGRADVSEGLFTPSADVSIMFDGQEVMKGPAGELRGSYKGTPVSASCNLISNNDTASMLMWGSDTHGVMCFVFVGNERAAQLKL